MCMPVAKLCAEGVSLFALTNKVIYTAPLNKDGADIEYSMREIEILDLIAEGLTNNQMSAKLFISKRTIEGHRQSLIEKTGVKNTASLIRFAVLRGIIQ